MSKRKSDHLEIAAVINADSSLKTYTVLGAGTEEVNGVYTICPDLRNGHPHYSKECKWKGKAATINLFCLDQTWYISVVISYTPGDSVDLLYRNLNPADAKHPMSDTPAYGWQTAYPDIQSPGVLPVPIVQHNDEHLLNWRVDPSVSFSDWTIQVTSADDSATTMKEYFVHKNILSLGKWRCEYFSRLFQARFAETKDRVSKVKLHSLAASRFSMFLDFIYNATPSISASDVAPLLHLADYFNCKQIRCDVKQFLSKERTEYALTIVYNGALAIGSDSAMEELAEVCASHLSNIKSTWGLYKVAPVSFWIPVLTKAAKKSPTVDRAVLAIAKHHKITKKDFDALTCNSVIPHIAPSCVWELLELESKFVTPPPAGDFDAIDLTDLQVRCLKTLRRNLNACRRQNPEIMQYAARNPHFCFELLKTHYQMQPSRSDVNEIVLNGIIDDSSDFSLMALAATSLAGTLFFGNAQSPHFCFLQSLKELISELV
ncbi:hypothetical protein MPSEU_000114800 [Mayamaea pseudoterrestris]|nr:hypothetical protein MPSEU_000114800 [Mayamaea pseudoterrestris]